MLYCSKSWLLVVLRIYVALVVFQPYRDLEAEDNQSTWKQKITNL